MLTMCLLLRNCNFGHQWWTVSVIRSLSILPCRMLLSLGILIYFMADPLVSVGTTITTPQTTRRFDRIEEGGDWQYGDVRWFGVPNVREFADCINLMKPNRNWRPEEHTETKYPNEYYNAPRYYLNFPFRKYFKIWT